PVDLLDQAELARLDHHALAELEQRGPGLATFDDGAKLAERARAFANDIDAGLGLERVDIADLDRIAAQASRFDHADLLGLRARRPGENVDRRQARRRRHESTPLHLKPPVLLFKPPARYRPHPTTLRRARPPDKSG